MKSSITDIATGRSVYSTLYLLLLAVVIPVAMFTDWVWLDTTAWVMLIILGVFIFITGIVGRYEAKESKKWPSVMATLRSCSIKRDISSGSAERYAPVIKCHFNIGGKSYEGTEFDFSSERTSKAKALAKIDKLADKKHITIYYNPNDPSSNVYRPGLHSIHSVRQLFGLITAVISSLSLLGIISYN